jgi:hypothetical protein
MMMNRRTPVGTGKEAIASPKVKGAGYGEKAVEHKGAHIMIIIMEAILDVSIKHCQKVPPLICLLAKEITRAPKAPTPAASVVVNTPP